MPTYVYIYGKRKFVFLGRQTIIGSLRVLFQQMCPSMYVYVQQEESQTRRSRKRHPERDTEQGRQNKTSWSGQKEWDRLNWIGITGQAEQYIQTGTGQNTTSGSGQGEQDRQSGGQSYIYSVTKSHN